MILFPLFPIIAIICFVFIVVNFIYFLFKGKLLARKTIWKIIETLTAVVTPIAFLASMDLSYENECCTESAIFSPDHRIGIYLLLTVCIATFAISIFRTKVLPPISEFSINLFLMLGLVLNVLLSIQLNNNDDGFFWVFFGNVPIIMLLLIKLTENHLRIKAYFNEHQIEQTSPLNNFALQILNLDAFYKFPILLMLLIPFLIILSMVLVLFGQKPDSMIRAFTDTYKHGFSQLDYMCDNVRCGGHFLCSVGANGHKQLVKPIRYGKRNGDRIICNRQLLISNAFEEMVQEFAPSFHKRIRNNYNKVGNIIHRYYGIFEIKIVSDLIYLFMKPLEWFFLFALYLFCEKPEDRIAMQYLSRQDRLAIKSKTIVKI